MNIRDARKLERNMRPHISIVFTEMINAVFLTLISQISADYFAFGERDFLFLISRGLQRFSQNALKQINIQIASRQGMEPGLAARLF